MEFEVRLENVGTVAMKIPRTPHLADLQPEDASVPFDYYDLRFSLQIAPFVEIGAIHLYGTEKASVFQLQPGEWVRVRGRTQVHFNETLKTRVESGELREELTATYSLRSVKFNPHPGGYSTMIGNIYPRHIMGAGLSVELRKPGQENLAANALKRF